MDRNLYAPPAASVADPVETRGSRPWQVTGAVALVWILVAYDIVILLLPLATTFISFPSLALFSILGFLISPVAFKSYIVAWLNTLIARGRNWARIVLGILIAVAFIYTAVVWTSGKIPGAAYSFLVNNRLLALKLPIELAAVVLLFTPRANQWFKAMN